MQPRFPDFDYQDPAALVARLKKLLPPQHWLALETVQAVALAEGQSVLLVGGIVRDLILGRANLDLDFICLQDARAFARALVRPLEALAQLKQLNLIQHDAFGTARLDLIFENNFTLHLDLATARRELYARPAALPTVDPVPANLEEDLRRRDFTINALALSLDKGLLDPFNGVEDLREGWLRILHPHSFEDDPTRMVRGVRFAARFGYQFEPQTERLLKAALAGGFLGLLSAERRRNELFAILREALPEKALALLEQYGLLRAIHSELAWTEGLQISFRQLRAYLTIPASVIIYLAVLLHLTELTKLELLAKDLRLTLEEGRYLVAVARLCQEIGPKLEPELKNSQLYGLLHLYDYTSGPNPLDLFEALALPGRAVQVKRYLDELRHIKPELDGDFLKNTLGLKPGPQFRVWLADLQVAVLDREVQGREAEETFLRQRVLN